MTAAAFSGLLCFIFYTVGLAAKDWAISHTVKCSLSQCCSIAMHTPGTVTAPECATYDNDYELGAPAVFSRFFLSLAIVLIVCCLLFALATRFLTTLYDWRGVSVFMAGLSGKPQDT